MGWYRVPRNGAKEKRTGHGGAGRNERSHLRTFDLALRRAALYVYRPAQSPRAGPGREEKRAKEDGHAGRYLGENILVEEGHGRLDKGSSGSEAACSAGETNFFLHPACNGRSGGSALTTSLDAGGPRSARFLGSAGAEGQI